MLTHTTKHFHITAQMHHLTNELLSKFLYGYSLSAAYFILTIESFSALIYFAFNFIFAQEE